MPNEVKTRIEALARALYDVVREKDPYNTYFTLSVIDGRVSYNNDYWDKEYEHEINGSCDISTKDAERVHELDDAKAVGSEPGTITKTREHIEVEVEK